MRYFLNLAYNGSTFHGWQRQPNARSVQEYLEEALSTLLRKSISITGAGRTDAGVHAKEMIAHFETELSQDLEDNLVHLLNRYLDHHIKIHHIRRVGDQAHARFDAIKRTYQYRISLNKDPFQQGLSYHFARELDVDLMQQGAQVLTQYSDFEAFSKTHTDVKTFLCSITEAYWETNAEGLIFTISANRFLRNMVRAIVGTLIELGSKKITVADLHQIIESKNRSKAGFSVPAHGLYLSRIIYPETIYLSHD